MPKPSQFPPAAEPAPSPRAAGRRASAQRKLRILERLTAGVSVIHTANVEKLTVRRVRQIIAEMLAEREVDPPAGFVQLQIARLSDAMQVAHTMMMEGDLQAMDRMIRLTGELDRYHGFGRAEIAAAPAPAPQIAPPTPAPPRLAAPTGLPPAPAPMREVEDAERVEAEIFRPAKP